jgi:hypothetical protein
MPQRNPIRVLDPSLSLDENLDILGHWSATYSLASDPKRPMKIEVDFTHPFLQPLEMLKARITAFALTHQGSLPRAVDNFQELVTESFRGLHLNDNTARRMTGVAARLAIDSLIRDAHEPKSIHEGSSYLLNGHFWDNLCSDSRSLPGFNTHYNAWRSSVLNTFHLVGGNAKVKFDSGVCDGNYHCSSSLDRPDDYTVHYDRLGMLCLSTEGACVLGNHETFHAILTGDAANYIKKWEPEWPLPAIYRKINWCEDVRVTAAGVYVNNNPKLKPYHLYQAHTAFLVSYMKSLDPDDPGLLANETFYLAIKEGLGATVRYNCTAKAEEWLVKNRDHIIALSDRRTIPLGEHGRLNLSTRDARRDECGRTAAEHLYALVTSRLQQEKDEQDSMAPSPTPDKGEKGQGSPSPGKGDPQKSEPQAGETSPDQKKPESGDAQKSESPQAGEKEGDVAQPGQKGDKGGKTPEKDQKSDSPADGQPGDKGKEGDKSQVPSGQNQSGEPQSSGQEPGDKGQDGKGEDTASGSPGGGEKEAAPGDPAGEGEKPGDSKAGDKKGDGKDGDGEAGASSGEGEKPGDSKAGQKEGAGKGGEGAGDGEDSSPSAASGEKGDGQGDGQPGGDAPSQSSNGAEPGQGKPGQGADSGSGPGEEGQPSADPSAGGKASGQGSSSGKPTPGGDQKSETGEGAQAGAGAKVSTADKKNAESPRRQWGDAPAEEEGDGPSPIEQAAEGQKKYNDQQVNRPADSAPPPPADNPLPEVEREHLVFEKAYTTAPLLTLWQEHGGTIREMTRLYRDTMRNARGAAPQREARTQGDRLNMPGYLRHTHIDSEYEKIFHRKPIETRESEQTFHLVLDSSGSMYCPGNPTIKPATVLMAIQMLSILDAGHRSSLSAFADHGEVMIPLVKSVAEASPYLKTVLSRAMDNRNVHQSRSMGGGTEAYYSLRAPMEVIRQTKDITGPQTIVVFSDGAVSNQHSSATEGLIRECRQAKMPLLYVCYPQVHPSISDLVGEGSCLGLPDLSLSSCKKVHGALLEVMKRNKLLTDVSEAKQIVQRVKRVKYNPELDNTAIPTWKGR